MTLAYHADRFPHLDPDNKVILDRFDHAPGVPQLVLEVGANDSYLANVLAANGHQVLGVDLRGHTLGEPHPNCHRLEGDFVALARAGLFPAGRYDAVVSASALEHFGLGTYDQDQSDDPFYDEGAMDCVAALLKPGGRAYLTVPYGGRFLTHGKHWRVYDAAALRERLIGDFKVEEKLFFKSAECAAPAGPGGWVAQADADHYGGDPPHLTVFLKLRKRG